MTLNSIKNEFSIKNNYKLIQNKNTQNNINDNSTTNNFNNNN
jgi:hypothetical protein